MAQIFAKSNLKETKTSFSSPDRAITYCVKCKEKKRTWGNHILEDCWFEQNNIKEKRVRNDHYSNNDDTQPHKDKRGKLDRNSSKQYDNHPRNANNIRNNPNENQSNNVARTYINDAISKSTGIKIVSSYNNSNYIENDKRKYSTKHDNSTREFEYDVRYSKKPYEHSQIRADSRNVKPNGNAKSRNENLLYTNAIEKTGDKVNNYEINNSMSMSKN
jgi:hypothetical protein